MGTNTLSMMNPASVPKDLSSTGKSGDWYSLQKGFDPLFQGNADGLVGDSMNQPSSQGRNGDNDNDDNDNDE